MWDAIGEFLLHWADVFDAIDSHQAFRETFYLGIVIGFVVGFLLALTLAPRLLKEARERYGLFKETFDS